MQSFRRRQYPRKMRILMALGNLLFSLLLDLIITVVVALLIIVIG